MSTSFSFVLNDTECERLDFLVKNFQAESPDGLKWRRSDVMRCAINTLYALRKDSADKVSVSSHKRSDTP